jgi:tetratricopeptide (TPR) repeat protein
MLSLLKRPTLPASRLVTCLALFSIPAAASEACANCHPEQVKGYARTGMANSIGKPASQPDGRIRHRLSGSRMDIVSGPAGMRHRLERDGLAAQYDADYFVGSGNKGRSYLVAIGGRLFQSPAAYYTARKAWDLSPGFEVERDLDFDRPILPECLFCHAGRARPVPFTLNAYESPPFESEAITCERCHGAPDRHIVRPSADNIVNPAKLEPRLRDAVCDQCHLGGEARILNPGRQPWDYQPGEPLENVLTVYVFDGQASDGGEPLKVVSHSEQLAASKCAQQSGSQMWCGTCHDPHDKPLQPAAYYKERCTRCHDTASLADHVKPAEDCAGCHMPSRPTYDGGHTAFTDHRILAKPRAAKGAQSVPKALRPWRDPPRALSQRNLGLAHISVGERHQSAEHLNEGFRHLSGVESEFASDPAVLTSLGAVLQRKRVPREAARLFSKASKLEPRDARHRLNLAIALMEAGETQRAISTLETAISDDASLRDAYVLLAEIYGSSGQAEKRRQTLERYLKFMPQSIVVRTMLRR